MEGNLMIFTDDVPKGVNKSERIGMFFPIKNSQPLPFFHLLEKYDT